MTAEVAVERLNGVLAHLWMIRTFLKHAEEIEHEEEFLEIPRLLYDSIRAVEPAYLRKDHAEYLRRLRGKLSKLRKAAEFLSANYARISAHTNFEMAAASLAESVTRMSEIFETLKVVESDSVD